MNKDSRNPLDNSSTDKSSRLKSDRTFDETKESLLLEYDQTMDGTHNALIKTQRLAKELDLLADYFRTIKKVAKANYNYIDQHTAQEQFGIGEEKLKDIFNLRWQHEFNMFSISSFHFLIDGLSWKLWNWNFDEEAIEEKHQKLKEGMQYFINSKRYNVFDKDEANAPFEDHLKTLANLPLPKEVLSLWTSGSRMPAAVKANPLGFHHADSPFEDGERIATWDELINPLVVWKDKNVEVFAPTYNDEENYTIGGIAAMFSTTPFTVLKMLQEDLLRTDTEEAEYISYNIKGSVLNNFINELFEIKRIVKETRLNNYKEKMKSLHGGQKSLDLKM